MRKLWIARMLAACLACSLAAACDASELAVSEERSHGDAQPGAHEVAPPPLPARIERPDGIVIEVAESGDGPALAVGDEVAIHYRSSLAADGSVFDDTFERGTPYRFELGRKLVFPGLERALLELRVGTRATLHIPAALAYGERGKPRAGIPPDSDLVYDVRVMSATRPGRTP